MHSRGPELIGRLICAEAASYKLQEGRELQSHAAAELLCFLRIKSMLINLTF